MQVADNENTRHKNNGAGQEMQARAQPVGFASIHSARTDDSFVRVIWITESWHSIRLSGKEPRCYYIQLTTSETLARSCSEGGDKLEELCTGGGTDTDAATGTVVTLLIDQYCTGQ